MDPSVVPPWLTDGGLAFVSSALVSFLKPPIEQLCPPENKWHDLVFHLLPIACSIAIAILMTLAAGPTTLSSLTSVALNGLLAGVGANGLYKLHQVTRADGSAAATQPVTAPPPPPPPPPIPQVPVPVPVQIVGIVPPIPAREAPAPAAPAPAPAPAPTVFPAPAPAQDTMVFPAQPTFPPQTPTP